MEQQKFLKDKVSVVTPVFNGETHLSPMLDSVLGQTYPYVEMILVDDGSTDATIRLAESYRERFAAKGYEYRIVQAEHKNASAAINQGLLSVTGEYLVWPDSDDKLEPESIERRVRFLQEYPRYQCVRNLPYYFEQGTGKLVKAEEQTGNIHKERLFWDILEFRTYVCCGCYMIRTKSFFEIYPKRHIPEYNVGQNFQMLLPFLYCYSCPTIPEKLYGVCVREGSHSRMKLTRKEEEEKYQEYEDMVDEIAEICHISDKDSKDRIAYWKLRRRYGIAVKYRDKKKFVKVCYQLYQYGKLNIFKLIKDCLWFLLEDTWVVKDIYPIYRRQAVIYKRLMKELFALKEIKSVWCRGKIISLTFDDGYQYTSDILKKLEEHDVKATFFLAGDWIREHADEYQKILQSGHDVGNHSYSHLDMTKMTDIEACEEIEQVQQLSWKLAGKKSRLFRFPYGKSNKRLVRDVASRGMVPVYWSINSLDWENISAKDICNNITNHKCLKGGAIILMHTTHRQTVEALDLIVPALRKKGYQFVTVSDLLKRALVFRYK